MNQEELEAKVTELTQDAVILKNYGLGLQKNVELKEDEIADLKKDVNDKVAEIEARNTVIFRLRAALDGIKTMTMDALQ